METIRRAAETKWPRQVIQLNDIVAWTEAGAPDIASGIKTMNRPRLSPQDRATLLISSGGFEPLA